MSEKFDTPIVEPISWPADQDAARAVQEYLTWLRSEGSQGSELGGAFDFREANLTGFQLKWKFLWGANFSGVVLDGADLYKSELVGAVLNMASLRGARLHRTDMSECEARGAVFIEANLLKARMSDSELVDADFRKTWTSGAHFDDADLRGADFRDARFGPEEPGGWTRLSGARMGGSRLSGAEGYVIGPVDVGTKKVDLIDGSELHSWFVAQNAAKVNVARI